MSQANPRDSHDRLGQDAFAFHGYRCSEKQPCCRGSSPGQCEAIAGGEGGIRTPGTGLGPYDGLANRCFRPLSHLSARLVGFNSDLNINSAGEARDARAAVAAERCCARVLAFGRIAGVCIPRELNAQRRCFAVLRVRGRGGNEYQNGSVPAGESAATLLIPASDS